MCSLVLLTTIAAAQVLRTGDPSKRGYKDTDFPRVQKLAEGVYSYEQLRSAGTEKFTTVSLFVVTSEVVPLSLRVVPGEARPQIELTRRDGEGRWQI